MTNVMGGFCKNELSTLFLHMNKLNIMLVAGGGVSRFLLEESIRLFLLKQPSGIYLLAKRSRVLTSFQTAGLGKAISLVRRKTFLISKSIKD